MFPIPTEVRIDMRAIFVDLPETIDKYILRENGRVVQEEAMTLCFKEGEVMVSPEKIAVIDGYEGALALANDLYERNGSKVEVFMLMKTIGD